MNATATKPNRGIEKAIRFEGLRELDRKQIVLNFQAYWPGEEFKNVSKDTLIRAIIKAEFEPGVALKPEWQSKATATWGRTAK